MEVNESEQKPGSKGINKHTILMLLCCLAPILLIIAMRVLGVQNSFLFFAAVLVCPLSMLIMMVVMGKKSSGGQGHMH